MKKNVYLKKVVYTVEINMQKISCVYSRYFLS